MLTGIGKLIGDLGTNSHISTLERINLKSVKQSRFHFGFLIGVSSWSDKITKPGQKFSYNTAQHTGKSVQRGLKICNPSVVTFGIN